MLQAIMRIKNPLRSFVNLAIHRSPLEAQLIVTRRCNLSCGYCTEYDNVSPPIPVPVLKERIDALHRLRVINISMLGGEPMMHPELPEIIQYANRYSQVSVTTNGFLITEKSIDALNAVDLQNMEVSIDSLHVDRTGYIQKTLKTLAPKLALLKERAKFDIHVNVVLCEETKHSFQSTLEELQKFDVPIAIDLYHDDKGAVGIQGEIFVRHWDYHYEKGHPFTFMEYDYGKSLLKGERPQWKCRAGSRMLYVDEFGKVQYCSAQRGRLNIPVTEYSASDLSRESKTYKGCEGGCSVLCGFRDSQIDNAPWSALSSLAKTFWRKVPVVFQA